MIIFTPAHVVVNKTPVILEIQEMDSGIEWMEIPKDDCASLWPTQGRDSLLRVRVKGTSETTPSFHFHSTHSCLLQLYNKVQLTLGAYDDKNKNKRK